MECVPTVTIGDWSADIEDFELIDNYFVAVKFSKPFPRDKLNKIGCFYDECALKFNVVDRMREYCKYMVLVTYSQESDYTFQLNVVFNKMCKCEITTAIPIDSKSVATKIYGDVVPHDDVFVGRHKFKIGDFVNNFILFTLYKNNLWDVE